MVDEGIRIMPVTQSRKNRRKQIRTVCFAVCLVSLCLLILLPGAASGVKAICNRLFSASEAKNAYLYTHFEIPPNTSTTVAGILLCAAGISLLILTGISRSALPALCWMFCLSAAQSYLGLSLPVWLIVPVSALFGWFTLKKSKAGVLLYAAAILGIAAAVILIHPGEDPRIENFSEGLRDRLGSYAMRLTGAFEETPQNWVETRHVNSRSLIRGDGDSQASREFRIVTREEEQISKPPRTILDMFTVPGILLTLLICGLTAAVLKLESGTGAGIRRRNAGRGLRHVSAHRGLSGRCGIRQRQPSVPGLGKADLTAFAGELCVPILTRREDI